MAQIQMEVHNKLNQLREEIRQANPHMSGENKFQNFNYFNLADFLPLVIEKSQALNLSWTENFYTTNVDGLPPRDVAELTIIHHPSASSTTFTIPVDYTPTGKMQPMQVIGAVITYARRYLWYNALALTDFELLDALDQDKQHPVKNNSATSLNRIAQKHQTQFAKNHG
tara:strand:+ start:857 stop:1363 length:507 start_codon:yes stop_codon:yes gene_type:complete